MSRTQKHPPKPDRFTKKHRTGAHQARTKRERADGPEPGGYLEAHYKKLVEPFLAKP